MKLLKQARENEVFSLETRLFASSKNSYFSKENPSYEYEFYLHENKTEINFHIIGFALSLALNWDLLRRPFA